MTFSKRIGETCVFRPFLHEARNIIARQTGTSRNSSPFRVLYSEPVSVLGPRNSAGNAIGLLGTARLLAGPPAGPCVFKRQRRLIGSHPRAVECSNKCTQNQQKKQRDVSLKSSPG